MFVHQSRPWRDPRLNHGHQAPKAKATYGLAQKVSRLGQVVEYVHHDNALQRGSWKGQESSIHDHIDVRDIEYLRSDEIRNEFEQRIKLLDVERDWEKKMLEQSNEHLNEVIASQDKKISSLSAELVKAQAQVNEVAKKAIEGASLHKAFQSVNQIALEQARPKEGKSSKE